MSSLSLSRFTELLNKEGFARTTLFIVEFGGVSASSVLSDPTGAVSSFITSSWDANIMNNTFADRTNISLYVRDVNIPGSALEVKPWEIDRTPIDIPVNIKNAPLKISFMCDPAYNHRQYFQEWMDRVINPTTMTSGFYDDIVTNIKIKTFDVTGNAKSVMEIVECYPIDISDILLSYDAESSVVKFDVTFTYKLKYHRGVVGDNLSQVEEELAKIASGKGVSDFEAALQGIEGLAQRGSKFVDAVIGKPLQAVRNIQSRVSETINKVYTPIAKAKSGVIQSRTVVSGSKKLLNVLKR